MNHPFGAIILLRFRLMYNQATLGSTVALLLIAILGLLGLGLSIGAGIGCYMVIGMRQLESPETLLVILDAIVAGLLFFWALGLMMEMQQSSFLDFRKMLHFPISMRGVFLLNFGASLCSPALIFFVSTMAGAIAGLHLCYSAPIGPCVALAVAFYIMGAAWLFWLRGWLARLMTNDRRRKVVVAVASMILIPVFQAPFLLFNVFDKEIHSAFQEEQFEAAIRLANAILPPAWLPFGLWRLSQDEWLDAACCAAGMALLAAFALWLGYRGTLRHYRGVYSSRPAGARASATPWKGRVLTLCRIPLLDEETSALAAAYWLTLMRNPNLRMAVFAPLVMGVIVLALYLRMASEIPFLRLRPETLIAFLVPVMYLGFWPYQFNIFGIDPDGFRRLMLLPAPRHRIFIAINLALGALMLGAAALLLALAPLMSDWSPRRMLLTAAGALWMWIACSIAGNVWSHYFPFRMEPRAVQERRNQWVMLAGGIAIQLLLGMLFLPIALCIGLDMLAVLQWGPNAFPAGLAVMLALIAAAALVYRFTLPGLGDLLISREHRILEALARKHE